MGTKNLTDGFLGDFFLGWQKWCMMQQEGKGGEGELFFGFKVQVSKSPNRGTSIFFFGGGFYSGMYTKLSKDTKPKLLEFEKVDASK